MGCLVANFGLSQKQERPLFILGEFNSQRGFFENPQRLGLGFQAGRHEVMLYYLFDAGMFYSMGEGISYKYHWYQSNRLSATWEVQAMYYETDQSVATTGKPIMTFFGVFNIGSGLEYRLWKGAWLNFQPGMVIARWEDGYPFTSDPNVWCDIYMQGGIRYRLPLNAAARNLPGDNNGTPDSTRHIMFNLRGGYNFSTFSTPFPHITPEVEIAVSNRSHLVAGLQFTAPLPKWRNKDLIPFPKTQVKGFYAGWRFMPMQTRRLQFYLDVLGGYGQTFINSGTQTTGYAQLRLGAISRYQLTPRMHVDFGTNFIVQYFEEVPGYHNGDYWTETNLALGYRFALPRKKAK